MYLGAWYMIYLKAFKQLSRLEKIIAGDAVSGKGEVRLVAGPDWSAVDPEVLQLARHLAEGHYLEALERSKVSAWLLQPRRDQDEETHIADILASRVMAYVCGEDGKAAIDEKSCLKHSARNQRRGDPDCPVDMHV